MWLTIDGNRMFVLLRELTGNLNSGVMAFDILSDGSLANPTDRAGALRRALRVPLVRFGGQAVCRELSLRKHLRVRQK